MGVSGLWDILAPAGKSRSLAKLAIDAFESNASGERAYRVGIDASIWYRHAAYSQGGENPELRLLFFRVAKLARLPLLPLIVFDGRSRPQVKRGSRMGKSGTHSLTRNFKNLLEIFGIPWREANGEAEAELAFLNRVGVIDAIMTDDVDAFLFGATTIIRNPSKNLTGNRANPALNLDGKLAQTHVMEFKVEDLQTHPEIGMTQGGMILFALLKGGDYDKGVDGIGEKIAYALARRGFGDELWAAVLNRDEVSLHNFLPAWRHRVNTELRENRLGYLGRPYPGLCLPDFFPSLELLDKYVRPARYESGTHGIWKDKGLSLPRVAEFCEQFFEWGTRTEIMKRFRSLLWEACIVQVLRYAALEQDEREADKLYASGMTCRGIHHCRRPETREAIGTSISLITRFLNPKKVDSDAERISAAFVNRGPLPPSVPDDPRSFIIKIHKERNHVSTDRSLEYQIETDPTVLVELTQSGLKGRRATNPSDATTIRNANVDDAVSNATNNRRTENSTNAPLGPFGTFKMWCPAPMLRRVAPQLIEEYERAIEEKKQKTTRRKTSTRTRSNVEGKGRTRSKRRAVSPDGEKELSADDDERAPCPSPQKKRKVAPVRDAQCGRPGSSSPSGNLSSSQSRRCTNTTSVTASFISMQTATACPSNTNMMRRAESAGSQTLHTSQQASPPASESRRTASQISRVSGDDWDAYNASSLFLFSMLDPCDPDLVERADLRPQPPEPMFRWTDLSTRTTYMDRYDADGDFNPGEDELDRSFERDFVRKAQKSNRSFALRSEKDSPYSSSSSSKIKALGGNQRSYASSGKQVNTASMFDATTSASGLGRAPSFPVPTELHTAKAVQDFQLFLPSRPPSPVNHEYLSSSQPRSQPLQSPDVIEVDSSDDDLEFSSSSFDPPSSLLSSPTPASSQGREMFYLDGQLASCSQGSGIAMCEGDELSIDIL